MQKHVLMVGRAREVVARTKSLGVRYTQMLKLDPGLTAENLTSYHRVVGLPAAAGVEEWVAQAKLIHAIDPFDAIGAFTETGEEFAAVIAGEIGLWYHRPEVIEKTHHKRRMRVALREAGLDDTASRLLDAPGIEAVQAFAAEHGYPVVLKPVDARGSLGVSVARDAGEVAAALHWFQQWADGYQLLIEQFLDGDEWSVEAFSENGRHRIVCITQKFKDPATFIETGHCLPARLEPSLEAAIHELVRGTLDAMGITAGPSHTEIIVTPRGPRVVETHTRLAGDRIVDLIALLSGVELRQLWMRQVLGESVIEQVPANLDSGFAAIDFISPRVSGVIERIDGLEQARAHPGVQRVDLLLAPGAMVGQVHDSFSRGASVIATGASAGQALERAREASGMIRFVVSCAG